MILFWVILHIPSILLANDTVLMNNSPKSSQCLPNHVEKYAFTWRLHYNPSKVVFIVFNKTKKCSVSHRVKLFESDISKPDSSIYAGYILQSNIKCDKLTERVCKTTRSKIHYLYSIGVNDSEIHPVVSSKILKRVVFLSFFCEIWPHWQSQTSKC